VRPSYDAEQARTLEVLEHDVREHLCRKRKRLAHSLSVAETCEGLACAYGVDPFEARCSGLLHDWEKSLTREETLARASALGIDMGCPLELVVPLLHGPLAARELPSLYPSLPHEVFQAIDRHTLGDAHMSPLDEVLFVADGIEPLRPGSPGIERVRSLVGEASLHDLFWESFVGGIVYVLDTRRYLYEGTIRIYNALTLERTTKEPR
jgi:predicted HD superfamily hydrolase involved in NAD metabolism